MAVYKKLIFTQATDNLIKRSVVIEIRRYYPVKQRFVVTLLSGWPMERNPQHYRGISKIQALNHLINWLQG